MEHSEKEQIIGDNEIVELRNQRQLFSLSNLTSTINFRREITYWEQIVCAGYNPYEKRLEAVVNVKRAWGYNGNLCSRGSLEYVKFFVDFKDGSGFHDMGYTSFKVADISDAPAGPQHPVSYLAFMYIDDSAYKKFLDCNHAVIPTLRAVLSWNAVPNFNPFQVPHYGNHLQVDIQLAKLFFIPFFDFAQLVNNDVLINHFHTDQIIKLKEAYVEDADTIYRVNTANQIPDHRTFYSSIGASLNTAINFSKASSVLSVTDFDKYHIDFSQFLNFFNGAGKEANTDFEELTCVGLNPAADKLGAVIHIKKSTGFNGSLCTKGSNEHVAFWADWNNDGIFDQHLGTVSLNIHDISNIPANGLYYNVLLPVDVSQRLKHCNAANIIRVRAVLSWESLPSTTNPDLLNHWGNYKDALVQLRPSNAKGQGVQADLTFVGGANRKFIDDTTHLYLYQAGISDADHNRPWGGSITFHGIIDRDGFNGVIKYRILYKKWGESDTSYQPVSISETFHYDDFSATPTDYYDTQINVPDGWFEYKPNPAGLHLYSYDNRLATWNAGALTDGTYTICFVYTDELGTEQKADEFSIIICNKGMSVSAAANASVDMASDLDLVIDGGDCHSYTSDDDVIDGHLRAVHPYFASWSLVLEPTSHSHGISPSPAGSTYNGVGDANLVWSLDTDQADAAHPFKKLDPCGYTVSLIANTRVILNSSLDRPSYGPKAIGFAKLS